MAKWETETAREYFDRVLTWDGSTYKRTLRAEKRALERMHKDRGWGGLASEVRKLRLRMVRRYLEAREAR